MPSTGTPGPNVAPAKSTGSLNVPDESIVRGAMSPDKTCFGAKRKSARTRQKYSVSDFRSSVIENLVPVLPGMATSL